MKRTFFIVGMMLILLASVIYAGLYFGIKGAVKKQIKKVDVKVREEKEMEKEFQDTKEKLREVIEELQDAEQERASGNANIEDVKAGKTFSRTGQVGLTGTMPTQTLSADTDTVNAGYYEAATLSTVDPDLAAANIKKDVCIFGSTGTLSGAVAGSATESDILSPKTADIDGDGVLETGTMPTQTLSAANETVSAGYYAATTLSAVDADLTEENIADGVVIFGKTGTMTGGAVPDTGQTTSYGTGDDADYNPAGTQMSYTDNGDGTITDNLTGLMWLKDTNNYNSGNTQNWTSALSGCESFTYATHTDWRLPNMKELFSIIKFEGAAPFINTTYFLNTVSGYYWTSTTYVPSDGNAVIVNFSNGDVSNDSKTTVYYVRPVRGGP